MRTFAILMLASLATAACVRTRTDPATGKVDVDVENPMKKGEVWNAKLAGQGNYPSVTGTAQATSINAQMTATIALTGATAGATHPWHVHEGKCGSGGAIVGDPSAYTPLTVGSDGTAQGNATVSTTLHEAKEYHVNVHLSPTEMGTIIACGNLDD